jgi:hypothetical protein
LRPEQRGWGDDEQWGQEILTPSEIQQAESPHTYTCADYGKGIGDKADMEKLRKGKPSASCGNI